MGSRLVAVLEKHRQRIVEVLIIRSYSGFCGKHSIRQIETFVRITEISPAIHVGEAEVGPEHLRQRGHP